jgi:hypothetical protein
MSNNKTKINSKNNLSNNEILRLILRKPEILSKLNRQLKRSNINNSKVRTVLKNKILQPKILTLLKKIYLPNNNVNNVNNVNTQKFLTSNQIKKINNFLERERIESEKTENTRRQNSRRENTARILAPIPRREKTKKCVI